MTNQRIFTITLVVLAALATGYVLLMSMRVVVLLLIAIIIASALRPLVARLTEFRIPLGGAILAAYAGVLGTALIVSVAVLPPVFNQLADYLDNDRLLAGRIIFVKNWFETNLTQITGQEVVIANSDDLRDAVSEGLNDLRVAAPQAAGQIGGALGEAALVLLMGVYWLTARDKSIDFVTRLVSSKHREKARAALLEIEVSIGAYIRGVVFVATVITLANFAVIGLFRVPNAAAISFIIGASTILPVVGGAIGGIVAVLLAMLGSPLNGLIVLGSFLFFQQIETNYLTPRTISRSVGVDPLLVLVGVFVGFTLGGAIGAIIAMPILSTIRVLLRDFVIQPRQEEVADYEMEHGIPVFKAGTPVDEAAVPLVKPLIKP